MKLTGYFDDSGDPVDESQQFYAVAGYVASEASWVQFNNAWQKVLAEPEFSIPYVHMRELHQARGAFKTWTKDDKSVSARTVLLLQRLVAVIGKFNLRGFGAAIYKKHLQRFNSESGQSLDARALAIYACILHMHECGVNRDVDIILDRMNGGQAAVQQANQYAKSDRYYSLAENELPNIHVLRKGAMESAKNIPGLQAADFLVWELRKQQELRSDWYERYQPRVGDRNWGTSLMQWFIEDRIKHMKRHGETSAEIPENFQRRSLTELATAAPVRAGLWDYEFLCAADKSRGGVW